MSKKPAPSQLLAERITRGASLQTYLTIRCLADRDRAADAFRAYAYFRWVDDCLDDRIESQADRLAFLQRQESLLDACYCGDPLKGLSPEEEMLADLVAGDREPRSGLQSYLRNMMAVMAFDADRRGRVVTRAELQRYSRLLAVAVMDALLHFIGHDCPAPCREGRYLAVRGAHIVHMLRDMEEDLRGGYFNIPRDLTGDQPVTFQELEQPVYREWVRDRVRRANQCFRTGREYIARVRSARCRLAGFAYLARFEWMARAIERDGYRLRERYPERKSLPAALWMLGRMLVSAAGLYRPTGSLLDRPLQPIQSEEP